MFCVIFYPTSFIHTFVLTLVRHDKKHAYPADRRNTSYSVLHLALNLMMISFRPVKFFQISTTYDNLDM